jgi:ATP-dependent DNA helicase UvrD/PcrA
MTTATIGLTLPQRGILSLEGDIVTKVSAAALIDRHLNAPFAYPALREQLRNAGIKAIERYFDTHGKEIANTEFSEKQIQVHVAPGITVDGRIDLIRRLDTGEVAIVDFKSTDRAQAEDVTRDQLHVYAVGYQELTGKSADLIEVLNLDEKGKTTREPVDDPLLISVRHKIQTPARRCARTSFCVFRRGTSTRADRATSLGCAGRGQGADWRTISAALADSA